MVLACRMWQSFNACEKEIGVRGEKCGMRVAWIVMWHGKYTSTLTVEKYDPYESGELRDDMFGDVKELWLAEGPRYFFTHAPNIQLSWTRIKARLCVIEARRVRACCCKATRLE